MSIELIHTSLARGLDGDSGYTVAGRTGGMPMAMSDALSRLSGLPPCWSGATQREKTMHAFRRVSCAGQEISVLSCIAPSGMDYTGRENRLSHHRVIDAEAMRKSDPAALLEDGSLWLEEWVGAARELSKGEIKPASTRDDAPLHTWEKVFGDAGFAASVLEAVQKSGIGLWLVVPAHGKRLRLAAEMASLLPLEKRWQVTFATRPIPLGGEASVKICFVDEREPELATQAANSGWILRVGSGALAAKPTGTLAERARHGADTAASTARGSATRSNGDPSRTGTEKVDWQAPARLTAPGKSAAPRLQDLVAAKVREVDRDTDARQSKAAEATIEVWRSAEKSSSNSAWKWFLAAAIVVTSVLWLAFKYGATI
ncbi:MAG: hypothetical protein K8R92_09735 [Planctomycetes bacterium]|nr:hypothetical protein [Planctomycetota bacterium]